MERIRKYLFLALILIAPAAGGTLGWLGMKTLTADYMHGGRLYLLLCAPSSGILETLKASAGNNEVRRAAAWYALQEYHLADPTIVKEAYKNEEKPYMKKLMLFILKQSDRDQWRVFTESLPASEQPVIRPEKRAVLSYTF